MKSEEELKHDFMTFVGASGSELTNVLMQGPILKLAEEYWAVVARSQKAQGEAEEAVTVAQAARADLERKTQGLKESIPGLKTQIRDLKAELDHLRAERAELSPTVAALKAEAKQHGERMAKSWEGWLSYERTANTETAKPPDRR